MTSAVVLGGGFAGMLAATALLPHADTVTVYEHDELPDGPQHRRGLPQAHHNHMLMGGGVLALDSLLPGVAAALERAGAQRRELLGGFLVLSAGGWYRRTEAQEPFVLACSRVLLDHVVREHALRDGRIRVVQNTTATGLLGDANRVTGVRLAGRDGGTTTVSADFVVDATGRRSKAPQWLTDLGLPAVREDVVDAGFAYSSRFFEAPAGFHEGFPGILIQAQPATGRPGQGLALVPNEQGRWIVALIGTRGGQPPTDEAGFLKFARNLRHPIVADLLEHAKPVSEIRSYKDLASRRRFYDKLPVPDGFLALGDSASVVNPTYATGMSVAARSAVAFRAALDRKGLVRGLSRRVQKDVAKAADGPWQMALGADRWFPEASSTVSKPPSAGQQRMAARYTVTAGADPRVAGALFRVAAQMAPPTSMMTPRVLWSVLRGPRRPLLTAPEAIAQFPQLGELVTARETVPPEW